MDWFNQGSFRSPRDRLVRLFRGLLAPRHLLPVVFLCGKKESQQRDELCKHINREHPRALVFYAERVWDFIQNRERGNALQLETELAALSDIVIIIVESPGTIAELGAFTSERRLRSRVLPILQARYKYNESFINTGPVAWVNKDSAFRPALFAPEGQILTVGDRIDEHLRRLVARRGPLRNDEYEARLKSDPKLALFLVCDLISIAGPISRKMCRKFLRKIYQQEPPWSTTKLVGLASAVDLVDIHYVAERGDFYFRKEHALSEQSLLGLGDGEFGDFRAEFEGVLRSIPEAARIMEDREKKVDVA